MSIYHQTTPQGHAPVQKGKDLWVGSSVHRKGGKIRSNILDSRGAASGLTNANEAAVLALCVMDASPERVVEPVRAAGRMEAGICSQLGKAAPDGSCGGGGASLPAVLGQTETGLSGPMAQPWVLGSLGARGGAGIAGAQVGLLGTSSAAASGIVPRSPQPNLDR